MLVEKLDDLVEATSAYVNGPRPVVIEHIDDVLIGKLLLKNIAVV